MLLQGGIGTLLTITATERQALLAVARSFDAAPPPELHPVPTRREPGVQRGTLHRGARPGDRFNQDASWEAVLVPRGWTLLYTRDGEGYWQRPGKEGLGISATTNYQGSDLLSVFTTSTVFEAGRAYSKFAAYALLEHGGDFSAAARALAAQGFPTAM